ncbi:MAG: dihydropteroate synthase [Propionibacteriaceae bacterium]|nr:dihydropteroate synthase [Propionibacteriaceae bacterium]
MGTQVLGILNVTPDSFSDGGRWVDTEAAIAHGLAMVAEGAAIIDVGGESTRPDSDRVDEATEAARVVPVVRALVDAGVQVSVDTTRASVAAAVLEVGATWINDVSGGLADPGMLTTVARRGGSYITMHWRGHAREMGANAVYDDVVAEVARELAACRDAALAAGIAPDKLVLDPGIGFAKTAAHNWAILQHWDALDALGFPLLLAVSRKRFLGTLLGTADAPRPPHERDTATAWLSGAFAARGVWGVRVHDVRASVDAIAAATTLAGRSEER